MHLVPSARTPPRYEHFAERGEMEPGVAQFTLLNSSRLILEGRLLFVYVKIQRGREKSDVTCRRGNSLDKRARP